MIGKGQSIALREDTAGLIERHSAALERITVLERALEKIEIQSFDANAKRMAREALDG